MAFIVGKGSEECGFGTCLVFEGDQDHTTGAATHHLLAGVDLVHILGRGTEHRADAHVGRAGIGVVGGKVLTELGAQVVGDTHHGTEVGETALAGIAQLSQFLGPHPEGEGVAQNAIVVVGTLHDDSLGSGWWDAADGGLGGLTNLLILCAGVLLLAVLLLLATLLNVASLERGSNDLAYHLGKATLTGGWRGLDDGLQQDGV